MKNIMKPFSNFFRAIWHFIDKNIVVPITKLVYKTNPLLTKIDFTVSNEFMLVSLLKLHFIL